MARQPIFDTQQKVIAYELLCHSDSGDEHSIFDDSQATSELILNSYTSISDQGEQKRLPAFIALSNEIISNQNVPELPHKQVVLLVQPDAGITKEFVHGLLALRNAGYRIALNSFEYRPAFDNLLKIAHMVKLDASKHDATALKEKMDQYAPFKVTFIAENIDNFTQLEECVELGFKLFKGSFLSKPKVVKGKRVQANQIALLQLVQALQKPNVAPEYLEELIIRDPVLTFKLLRIVNSAAYSLVRKVESISEAVVLLGLEQVKKWATLISMSGNKDKPEELTRILLIRGRMCELVAEGQKAPNASSFFMAGMMSGLHAMLDIDQETMLGQVPLGEDITEAITDYAGPIGKVLSNVIHYEAGDWGELSADFDAGLHDLAYRAAMKWTEEALQAMHED